MDLWHNYNNNKRGFLQDREGGIWGIGRELKRMWFSFANETEEGEEEGEGEVNALGGDGGVSFWLLFIFLSLSLFLCAVLFMLWVLYVEKENTVLVWYSIILCTV